MRRAAIEGPIIEQIARAGPQRIDMRRILQLVLDSDSFFEMGAGYGRSQIVGLARLNGQPGGVWANNCKFLAG